MLMPLRSPRAPRRRVANIKNFPAPVQGWVSNVDSVESGPATAAILQNMVPKQNRVYVRSGSKTVSEIPASIETLASYDDGLSQELIAAAAEKVYRVPVASDGTVVAPVEIGTGFASGRWETVMFANGADQIELVMVNGADGIWTYDGTSLTEAPASTENKSVDNVTSFKSRLWFTKYGDATLYYGEVLATKPVALEPFPIGPLLRSGGQIVAINSLSMDGGSGPDDYFVAVSSRGEIVVFSGIDPATDFQLVGIFKGARPLGRRCLEKAGSDLIYYGANGPQFLTRLFASQGGLETLAIPIRTEFEDAISKGENFFGWSMVSYSKRGWVLFNVPFQAGAISYQYCLSLESQAWFKISGWNAACFVKHGDNLYFSTFDGKIKIADYGTNDDGVAIDFDYMQSWQDYGMPERKKFNMAQLTIEANAPPEITIDMNVDFKKNDPLSVPTFGPKPPASYWNRSIWNVALWSGLNKFYVESVGLSANGFVGALRYRGKIMNSTHILYGFRIAYEGGEFL